MKTADMTYVEKAKEFCTQNGLCWHEYEVTNLARGAFIVPMNCKKCNSYERNPDLTDAREVVKVMMKRKDFREFLDWIVSPHICRPVRMVPVHLMLDTTGQMLDLAVEFMGRER